MPIYEYECTKCSEVFETIVSTTSPREITCKKCGSNELRKLMSAAGIQVSAKRSTTPVCQPRGGFT